MAKKTGKSQPKKGSTSAAPKPKSAPKEHRVNNALAKADVDKTPRTLVSSGSFHDFNDEPVFEGVWFGETLLHEKDDNEFNVKAGDVRGYVFNTEDKDGIVIGANHSVSKAMDQVNPGAVMRFVFNGKIERPGKRPFNSFTIDLIGYAADGVKVTNTTKEKPMPF